MADYKVTDTELTSVANKIRTKGGTQAQLEWPTGYVSAIDAISGSATLVTKTITQNGTYDPADDNADGYSELTVNVPSGNTNILFDSADEAYRAYLNKGSPSRSQAFLGSMSAQATEYSIDTNDSDYPFRYNDYSACNLVFFKKIPKEATVLHFTVKITERSGQYHNFIAYFYSSPYINGYAYDAHGSATNYKSHGFNRSLSSKTTIDVDITGLSSDSYLTIYTVGVDASLYKIWYE